ncbi:MAG: hypothetical protein DWQ01_05215 [Planctomycetota bacterium]|nr:MAG: hypothetical protein DWQ01_05215 [Planctomycetota bacterium]
MIGLALAWLALLATAQEADPAYHVEKLEDRIRLEIGGQLFSEYRFQEAAIPFFYPLFGPKGQAMTRSYPMAHVSGEAKDHPHHRSLWFTHGNVNGFDFWHASGDQYPRIVFRRLASSSSGPMYGSFVAEHDWLAPDGKRVCRDRRSFRFSRQAENRLLEIRIQIIASEGPLRFGDTKEGSMAIRVHPALRLKGKIAAGQILNSEGKVNGKAWGKRARWVDYSGPIQGEVLGVAMFDHPQNFRHPTWWHARDYGLMAANPFGIHDFEGKAKGTGDFLLAKGETLELRYAVYLHQGNAQEAKVESSWQAWASW